MSELLEDSNVAIHIGDGFKFLREHEGTYDVIVTDLLEVSNYGLSRRRATTIFDYLVSTANGVDEGRL
ncbi:hypothetical protein PQX77_011736 [Marasmius sp. AFHP31]|nr:hypothetical protein PQX77_011736 [Marasmius sp. AFHP31]